MLIQSVKETALDHVLQIRQQFLIIICRNPLSYLHKSFFKQLLIICGTIGLLQTPNYIFLMFLM